MPRIQRSDRVTKTPNTGDAPPMCAAGPAETTGATVNETPLEYMLRLMRDPSVDDERRDGMAKAALPYLHARLSNVDGQISDHSGGTITFTWPRRKVSNA